MGYAGESEEMRQATCPWNKSKSDRKGCLYFNDTQLLVCRTQLLIKVYSCHHQYNFTRKGGGRIEGPD